MKSVSSIRTTIADTRPKKILGYGKIPSVVYDSVLKDLELRFVVTSSNAIERKAYNSNRTCQY